jgi:hypothetical protein
MGIIGISAPLLLELGNGGLPPGVGDDNLSEGERRGAGSGDRALLEDESFFSAMGERTRVHEDF